MQQFNYSRRNLAGGFQLLGILFILGGVFAILSPLFIISSSSIEKIRFVGGAFTLIGFLITQIYTGVQLDGDQKKVREYISIVGVRYGRWEPLPAISFIKWKEIGRTLTNTPNGISPTLSGRITFYKVILYGEDARSVYSFDYKKKHTAVKKVCLLESILKIKNA
ncbi:MAG: hypothetical protein AAFY41_14900 [Bacteroidota bacterium]